MAEERRWTSSRRVKGAIGAAVAFFILLNLETLADKYGWNRLIADAPDTALWGRIMSPVQEFFWTAVGYAAGPFGLGFVCGALFIAFLDWIIWPFTWLPRVLGLRTPAPARAAVAPVEEASGPASGPTPVAFTASEGEAVLVQHHFYVGTINVNCDKLSEELYLTINATVYNAYDGHIRLDAAQGHVVFKQTANRNAVANSVRDLPTPRLVARENVAPYMEFSVALEQRVPREVAAAILNVTRTDKVQLRLDKLDVLVRPVSMKGDAVRLPLWEGVALYREEGEILAGRMQAFRAVAGIGGSGQQR